MLVQLNDVSHRFERRWVLARLNLTVRAGQTVLLTGDNGAGKTTLLRLIATAVRPSRGEVRLFGTSSQPALAQVRQRLALMTHQNFLYEGLTALENLRLICDFSPRANAADIPMRLEHAGLAAHGNTLVATFSAGMKRRLALARLLLLRPELILLDEPFTQLDPGGVRMMEEVVLTLQKSGATLIISTHDIERGAALATAKLHLQGGFAQSSPDLQPL
jgi:heme exporter protein A